MRSETGIGLVIWCLTGLGFAVLPVAWGMPGGRGSLSCTDNCNNAVNEACPTACGGGNFRKLSASETGVVFTEKGNNPRRCGNGTYPAPGGGPNLACPDDQFCKSPQEVCIGHIDPEPGPGGEEPGFNPNPPPPPAPGDN